MIAHLISTSSPSSSSLISAAPPCHDRYATRGSPARFRRLKHRQWLKTPPVQAPSVVRELWGSPLQAVRGG
jgi:hypothetical protein